jgi:hypothetical protein
MEYLEWLYSKLKDRFSDSEIYDSWESIFEDDEEDVTDLTGNDVSVPETIAEKLVDLVNPSTSTSSSNSKETSLHALSNIGSSELASLPSKETSETIADHKENLMDIVAAAPTHETLDNSGKQQPSSSFAKETFENVSKVNDFSPLKSSSFLRDEFVAESVQQVEAFPSTFSPLRDDCVSVTPNNVQAGKEDEKESFLESRVHQQSSSSTRITQTSSKNPSTHDTSEHSGQQQPSSSNAKETSDTIVSNAKETPLQFIVSCVLKRSSSSSETIVEFQSNWRKGKAIGSFNKSFIFQKQQEYDFPVDIMIHLLGYVHLDLCHLISKEISVKESNLPHPLIFGLPEWTERKPQESPFPIVRSNYKEKRKLPYSLYIRANLIKEGFQLDWRDILVPSLRDASWCMDSFFLHAQPNMDQISNCVSETFKWPSCESAIVYQSRLLLTWARGNGCSCTYDMRKLPRFHPNEQRV